MNELQLRDRFMVAADQISVGPAPDVELFERVVAGRRRRWDAVLAVAGAAAVGVIVVGAVAGVGRDHPPAPGGETYNGPTTAPPSVPPHVRIVTTALPLSCQRESHSAVTFDNVPAHYSLTAVALAERFLMVAGGESAVVRYLNESHAIATILRSNGSATARVHLRLVAGQGWTPYTAEFCGGPFLSH